MKKPGVVRKAEERIDDATEPELEKRHATPDGPVGDDAELRSEMRDELHDSYAAPGLPVMTRGMMHGAVIGIVVGGIIGALVFLPLAAIPFGLDLEWRLVLVAIAGFLGGATAGASYFGGRLPELEGETVESDGTPGVGTTIRDPNTDSRGR